MTKIAEAGLSGDQQRLELVVITAIRALKRHSPEASKELGAVLSQYASNSGGLRWKASGPPPADSDEGLSLARVEEVEGAARPVLPTALMQRIDQFLKERREPERLLAEGFQPPGSVLLTGDPGTGKTILARWLAQELSLPLVSLDLATSISSFLGKTGFNLRRILDYARSRPCVLLLDEFDAVAKRRDDESELGELKRIVNVLLKELEDWPLRSVLIAATNHPGLLDPAVRRRFDLVLDLPLPGPDERLEIMSRAAGRFSEQLPNQFFLALCEILDAVSGSDLESLTHAAVRVHLTSGNSLARAFIVEVKDRFAERVGGKQSGVLVRALRSTSEGSLSVRELAKLFDKSASTIQHHLKRGRVDG
jgi:SpoVK/Ycf46/Vps4 family AAA+-type ATPase